jgi:hypothetical protein
MHHYTIKVYVNEWGEVPGERMRFLFYDDLHNYKHLAPGTYIFSDLERLSPPELEMAHHAWETLAKAPCETRLFNNPVRVLRRYELLSKLADEGINQFRVFRCTESLDNVRFPVFIREANEHRGNLTRLLHTRREMETRLGVLLLKGYPADDLLVVEFCDTSDAGGIFRKYSAYVMDKEILPRHQFFSKKWLLKKPDIDDPELGREQEVYLEENPHENWLKKIFTLAGIEYGRIDYSMLGDTPQVWEINTNPYMNKTAFRLTSAFEKIDVSSDSGEPVPFQVDSSLFKEIAQIRENRIKTGNYERKAKKLISKPTVRKITPVIKRVLRFSSSRPITFLMPVLKKLVLFISK